MEVILDIMKYFFAKYINHLSFLHFFKIEKWDSICPHWLFKKKFHNEEETYVACDSLSLE